ncbi:hypothetical protein U1Q18_023236, partial [Sarracenia purpurea var. burkii]
ILENYDLLNIRESYQNNSKSQNDGWDIRMKLKRTDIRKRYLYISGQPFNQNILPKMPSTHGEVLNSFLILRIIVLDIDTRDSFVMQLKKYRHGYILSDHWFERFVRRRDLKVNEEIGLRWRDLRMHFTKFR